MGVSVLKNFFGLLLPLAAIFVMGGGAYVVWASTTAPKTFEECILREMQGQNAGLLDTVTSVCQKRFNVSFKVMPEKGEWSYWMDGSRMSLSLTATFTQRYEPVSATALGSTVCPGEEGQPDYKHSVSLFSVSTYELSGYVVEPADYECLRIEGIYVRRK